MTSDINPDAFPSAAPPPPQLDDTSILGRNKRLLLAALREAGICAVTVTYTGVGDSGGVEDVEAQASGPTPFNGLKPVTLFVERSEFRDGQWHSHEAEQSVPIEQALRDYADDLVDWLHDGWEDGDGASGSVIFDCQAGHVRVEHTAYFTDSDYEETVL